MGPRFPAGALVAAGREHIRLARRRSAGHADHRQPADARSRSPGRDRADRKADVRRATARDRPQPQLSQGRRDDLVRVVSLVPARRKGRHRVDPLVRAGCLVAHPGGRAPAVPGHARCADRPAEPPAAAGAVGAGDRSGEAQRPPRRRALHRPRPLQERQRHARPPDRRRAAQAGDRVAVRRAARDRPAGAPRRRRIHGHRRGLRRCRGAEPHRAEAAGRDRAAVPDRGARYLRDLVDRHLDLP